MAARRILIVGETLFAESLVRLLSGSQQVLVVGKLPSLDSLQAQVEASRPDAIIIAGVASPRDAGLSQFLAAYPQIPVICTDLGTNNIQVIQSQRILVNSSSDLLAAITALTKPS